MNSIIHPITVHDDQGFNARRPGWLRKLFAFSFPRKLQLKLEAIACDILMFESQFEIMKNDDLKVAFSNLASEIKAGRNPDMLLPRALAIIREASKRFLGMRPFDVQMMGALVLDMGMIAEMRTGEGKTLVAAISACYNAIMSGGVRIITVNDYLASRDAKWMSPLYEGLGLTVGCITSFTQERDRRQLYERDILYITNNEVGFDYLRDNMRYGDEHILQTPAKFAIVDEVDSILIDEARTPLIISGPSERSTLVYFIIDALTRSFKAEHYRVFEKERIVVLTEVGHEFAERALKDKKILDPHDNLYDIDKLYLVHHITQAMRAHFIFRTNVDYMVREGQVVIVDEFTGRMMEGRRFSDGLHQALEAKENVRIKNESKTLASTTFQNYFKLYPKLAGMTGSAITEAGEFFEVYNLRVFSVPSNKKARRKDCDDEIYRTEVEKFEAISQLVLECHKRGQPVLIGTVSVDKSERLSDFLKNKDLKHTVLNARYHEQEAAIIAQAGDIGAVTVSTNMAGRGTDIKLGGADEENYDKVIQAGGLYVIGTERHESRRIDNQLRGRCARQGDIGESKFFLSLEDDLLRIFGGEKMSNLFGKIGMKKDEAIFHPWVSKAIESAQKRVEKRNFEYRKNVLKYDNIVNKQRAIVYEQRSLILSVSDERITDMFEDMMSNVNKSLVSQILVGNREYYEEDLMLRLYEEISSVYCGKIIFDPRDLSKQEIIQVLNEKSNALFEFYKLTAHSHTWLPQSIRRSWLHSLDSGWRNHLEIVEYLKQNMAVKAFGQKDPLHEFSREVYEAYTKSLYKVCTDVLKDFFSTDIEDFSQETLDDLLEESSFDEAG